MKHTEMTRKLVKRSKFLFLINISILIIVIITYGLGILSVETPPPSEGVVRCSQHSPLLLSLRPGEPENGLRDSILVPCTPLRACDSGMSP